MLLGFRKLNLRVALLNTTWLDEYTDLVADVRSQLNNREKSLGIKQLDNHEVVPGKGVRRMESTHQ